MMIGATKLYILISVWWPWPLCKITAVWEIKNFYVNFLRDSAVGLHEIQSVASACWFVQAHAAREVVGTPLSFSSSWIDDLGHWKFASWASTTSGGPWSSRCTGWSFSPASSMVVRHGPCTGDNWSSWSASICAACWPSWTSNGRTVFLT